MSTSKHKSAQEQIFREMALPKDDSGSVTRSGRFEVRETKDGRTYFVLKASKGRQMVLTSSATGARAFKTGKTAQHGSKPLALKVGKAGNSLMVRITKPIIDELGLAEGDELYATVGADGSLHLSPYDPDFQRKLNAYRRVARKNRNALAALAK